MNSLQQLHLSEYDFKLLIDGLEALPDRGMTGQLISTIMRGMMAKNKEEEERLKREFSKKLDFEKKEKLSMIEDIKILQGKLLSLKRYLKEQGALDETANIINNFSS